MKTVYIIGAGPAGLTAAWCLLKKSRDYQVVILEESDAIGGISRTVRYKGNRMDIGGHRFFSKDERVNRFWEAVMPQQGAPAWDDRVLKREVPLKKGGPDPEKEDRVMLVRHRVSRIYYKRKFFDYLVKMNLNTIRNMGFLQTGKAGFSYLAACLHKRPEDSLENFYINRFGRKLYSMFFEGYTEKLWGIHPSRLSADWGAQRVKGLSILAVVKNMVSGALPGRENRQVETSLIEQFLYPKLGPGQLWEQVAADVEQMGGKILKNTRVCGFQMGEGRIQKVVCQDTESGEQTGHDCDLVISSMPLKDLVEAMGEAAPARIRRIAGGLPYRDFVTVGLLVRRLNLTNTTKLATVGRLIPDCWIYVQDPGVKLGRIQIFNNWSPYMVEDPENTVWIGLEYFCKEGDDFWNLSPSRCATFAVKELIRMGVLKNREDVLDFHKEQVKKAYPAYYGTYGQMDELTGWLDQVENLYCVGRNGQHRYNNMDHSMATAFEAVDNILSGKTSRENIWKVNTEAEYHETVSAKKESE